MSSRATSKGHLSRFSSTCKHIFFPMSEGEREQEEKEEVGTFMRGGDDNMGHSDSDGTPPEVKRGRMREDIDNNSKLSKENRRMLVRIGERTAWIARLLVGVFMAIMGAVYLSGGI